MAAFEAGATVHGAQKCNEDPSRPILDQIADKWSMPVLGFLDEPKRFNEIRRHLDGVTQRVLTQTLRRLERNGMIVRRVLPTSPVGVEYSLTRLGESLREPFGRLQAWAVDNTDAIREHQRAYDQRMLDYGTSPLPVPASASASAPVAGSH
ncbi:winged helix-turn-helix transcriptional regulator [Streptacidiphilus rugosus]|uniref:winged helix-turn-helix transcriptional regulator n=1 Tax=Streptacidiphilus rugosus TaxID=405783 RepID=UPI00068B11D4|nr:helix-turn-helix domain-containing protein [Streptacidiphilus rugosus]